MKYNNTTEILLSHLKTHYVAYIKLFYCLRAWISNYDSSSEMKTLHSVLCGQQCYFYQKNLGDRPIRGLVFQISPMKKNISYISIKRVVFLNTVSVVLCVFPYTSS